MAHLPPIRDHALADAYGRAVLAVVRADDDIGLEESLRLQARLRQRLGDGFDLEALLLAPAITAAELAGLGGGDPFRAGGVHPGALAHALVADCLAIALAKGHVDEREAHALIEFARALGLADRDLLHQAPALRPWLRP
ncbi:MAG: hypothetical protein IPH44_05350 [Myxococcales bacterium]|nr:hypothetical protein [Myxococcales bacterium]MBK7193616.1 hypothetical protein [Myxococcales bacterium]MBP6844548.1 hypothetical protein [Kofleriaceae bacterium]